MKKIIVPFIFVLGLFFNQRGFAQHTSSSNSNPMQIGSLFVNAGVGFGAGYRYSTSNTAFGFKVAAEYGMWEAGPGVITLGPELGGSFSGDKNDGFSYSNNTFVVAGRAAWHNGWNVPNLDTYAGFSAGVGFNHYNDGHDDSNHPFPYFGAFVGASYFISPTFGFNSEFGYDITNFQVGVVFKLQ